MEEAGKGQLRTVRAEGLRDHVADPYVVHVAKARRQARGLIHRLVVDEEAQATAGSLVHECGVVPGGSLPHRAAAAEPARVAVRAHAVRARPRVQRGPDEVHRARRWADRITDANIPVGLVTLRRVVVPGSREKILHTGTRSDWHRQLEPEFDGERVVDRDVRALVFVQRALAEAVQRHIGPHPS